VLELECHPLTSERWVEFVQLFGENGACGGCWCMWWRQTRSEFEREHGTANRRAMKRIVDAGRVPGVLGYVDGEAIGWASIAPREEFASLERSPILRRLDDVPVWSLVCLFVKGGRRRQGVGQELIKCATSYAFSQGAVAVESYPTEPRGKTLSTASSFMGTPGMFSQAGFVECARPSKSRVVMRKYANRAEGAAP
jgi:GNAT superfamily N-acetyltransferase